MRAIIQRVTHASVTVNGGEEAGGVLFSLDASSNTYYVMGMDDSKTYYEKGQLTFPVADTCVLTDDADFEHPGQTTPASDLPKLLAQDDIYGFNPQSTTVTLKNGQITDTFQTFCMMAALLIIIFEVVGKLDMSVGEAVSAVVADSHSRVFVFDDFVSTQNFFKQFLSGVFIVVVMTGLDQHMMQKNLTCKTLRDAQKDMCVGGFFFVPVNMLFLALGVLLMLLAAKEGMPLPADSDELMPMFTASGWMGNLVLVLFSIGIVAASFSGTDSALTAVTTSYCVDIKERPDDERLRRVAHLGVCVLFAVFILLFRVINSTSVIDAIYIVLSYTSGPLLGLFAYGILTKCSANDRLVPYICIASPLVCFAIDQATTHLTGYKFGYELLMLNGMLVFLGLFLTRCRRKNSPESSIC